MKYQFFWQSTFLKAGEEKKNKEYVIAEEDALEKRLIMGANPPQLDLETRRRSFVLEFVSLDIYSEFVFFPQKLRPSRRTFRLLTNSRAPSRRFVTLLTNCFIGSLYRVSKTRWWISVAHLGFCSVFKDDDNAATMEYKNNTNLRMLFVI